ncbi:hypothetical protein [Streptomonospora arabica]|uniref:Uncharacterized protein n=1 Tax=Streptomonospora arabica TaxID=412417 RepID=A0ABV9SQB5_9ACTN
MAPLRARVRTEAALHTTGGAPPRLVADDQVWAADDAERPWLLCADVVSVRRLQSAPQRPDRDRGRSEALWRATAGAVARFAPACRVVVVCAPRPCVLLRGAGALPARSGWDARLLGSLAHTWLAAGLDPAELGRAWPGRVLSRFTAGAGRRSVAVSLRLGEAEACCKWTLRR